MLYKETIIIFVIQKFQTLVVLVMVVTVLIQKKLFVKVVMAMALLPRLPKILSAADRVQHTVTKDVLWFQ